METARIIKKYPNRRLYDTEESRYITLSDIKDHVVNNVPFRVVDRKTGQDISRAVLLQVISDQEQNGDAIMTAAFLSEVIRAYGKVPPGSMADYLEEGIRFFVTEQSKKPLTSGG